MGQTETVGLGSSLTPSDIEAKGFWDSHVTISRVDGTRHFVIDPDSGEEHDGSFCNGCSSWLMRKTDDGLMLCAGCGTRQKFKDLDRFFQ